MLRFWLFFTSLSILIHSVAPPAAAVDLPLFTMGQLRVFAAKSGTEVTIHNLETNAEFARFRTGELKDSWTALTDVPQFISISAEADITALTGKSAAGANDWAALLPAKSGIPIGHDFIGLTDTHLYIFACRAPDSPPSYISITDHSDADDTQTLHRSVADLTVDDIEIYHLDCFDFDTITVTSNIPISVLAGSSSINTSDGWLYLLPSAVSSERGAGIGTRFVGFTAKHVTVLALADGTNVRIRDLSDSDDSREIKLDRNSVFSTALPGVINEEIDWQYADGNLFDSDYFEVSANQPVAVIAGPVADPGDGFSLAATVANVLPNSPGSYVTFAYANGTGVAALANDETAFVQITSLSSSGILQRHQIGPGDWRGIGSFFWQAPASFSQELLKIEANQPITVFFGDYQQSYYAGCCAAAFLTNTPPPPTFPPVAEIEPAINAFTREPVFLDAVGTDPDGGDIILYEWDFNDDGRFDWSSPVSSVAVYSFAEPGNHICHLRITDDEGQTTTESVPISVSAVSPSPTASRLGFILVLIALSISFVTLLRMR